MTLEKSWKKFDKSKRQLDVRGLYFSITISLKFTLLRIALHKVCFNSVTFIYIGESMKLVRIKLVIHVVIVFREGW